MSTIDTPPSPARWPMVREVLLPLPVREFWVGQFSRTGSASRTLARVIARREEARDTVTLVLRPNRRFAGFQPGQHLNVTVEINGVRQTRSYSPTNVWQAKGEVALTIRRVDGGLVSTALVRHTPVGAVVELWAAFGAMTLPADTAQPLLLAAAGSGITPLMSQLRSLAAQGQAGRVTLLYWARHADQLCFVDELRALAARTPGLALHLLVTGETGLDGARAGRPDAALLARLVPDLDARRVHACGPAGFVQTLCELAGAAGATVVGEAFTPPPLAPVEVAGTVRVQLTASGRTLEVASGTPLLAALEAQGLKPAYGCRMGICNTCACGKSDGTSQNLLTGTRTAEPETAMRLCVSRAVTDLSLDL